MRLFQCMYPLSLNTHTHPLLSHPPPSILFLLPSSLFINLVILEFLTEFQKEQVAVVVIATAESKATVHPLLLQSRGRHIFDKIIEISPPTLVIRCTVALHINIILK